MNKTKPARLLPVQAAVERTASYAHVAGGAGLAASQQTNQVDPFWGLTHLVPVDPPPINWFGPVPMGSPLPVQSGPSIWAAR